MEENPALTTGRPTRQDRGPTPSRGVGPTAKGGRGYARPSPAYQVIREDRHSGDDRGARRPRYHGPIADDAVIREMELEDLLGGQAIADGAQYMGWLVPRQGTRRAVIFAGADIKRFRRALLSGEIDLAVILLANRLRRRPTDAEIAAMRAAAEHPGHDTPGEGDAAKPPRHPAYSRADGSERATNERGSRDKNGKG